jgi:uncharacterized protein (DUF4415 family)
MKGNNLNTTIKTNLERIDALTDDMIDTSDIPPLTDDFFATARWRMPKPKVQVMVEIEPEILDWFKAQGTDWKNQLTAALRIYAHAQYNKRN